jgi:two-component system, OmpR family, phosphate regulon response regulator PhoB
MTRKKLLLVEDDRALAELLIWHFEREDYEVRRTGDGEEALLLASESAPDVIILDWMIEGILGLEVCRRLRRRSETANVPIIMHADRARRGKRSHPRSGDGR